MFQQFGIRKSQLYNACFWSLKCHSGRHCWEVVCVHVSQCTCMCMLYCVSVFVLFCFFFVRWNVPSWRLHIGIQLKRVGVPQTFQVIRNWGVGDLTFSVVPIFLPHCPLCSPTLYGSQVAIPNSWVDWGRLSVPHGYQTVVHLSVL